MLLNNETVQSLMRIFVKFAKKLPVLSSIFFFSSKAHKHAIGKFLVLWIASTSPILFLSLLTPVPVGSEGVFTKFSNVFIDFFSSAEMFVYTTAFLSPVIYMIWEKYQLAKDAEDFRERIKQAYSVFGLNALLSIAVLIFAAIAYSANKLSPLAQTPPTFLDLIYGKYSYIFYFYSIYCWYLTMLDGFRDFNFTESFREQEEQSANSFKAQLAGRNKQ